MRGTRWLILLAIGAILGGVGLTYRIRKTALEREAPPRPKALPLDLASSAENWVWTQSMPGEGRPAVEIKAKQYGQAKDNSRITLQDVELRIFHKPGGQLDLVKSARAEFLIAEKRLYSDGEVQITLGLPAEGEPPPNLVSIRTSGVAFDSATGQAWTERPAEFTFEYGTGRSVGASYDPIAKRLEMKSHAVVDYQAAGPRSRPMRVEAGDLTYEEADHKIWLRPWARLRRDRTVIESGPAVLTLLDGAIRKVEAVKAVGTDHYPGRALDYDADTLWVDLSADGAVTKVTGLGNARLVSASERSATRVTADRVDLDFSSANGESVLTRALANGKAAVESRPVGAGRQPPETRLLRSEIIEVAMRPGGREIETVSTHAQGTLEFLPNTPAQRHRTLEAERMWIGYGRENAIETFRAVNVKTRTEPAAAERGRKRAAALTRSRGLSARFVPATGQLATLEQWDDFQYEEGPRKARADRAILDQASNTLVLEKRARVEDDGGSTAADHIRLDQASGDFTATGNVSSSRLPDKNPASGMLSGAEPLQAVAAKMATTRRNRLVVYEGGAVLWQGANRVEAERVEIDRDKRVLTATGKVATQLLDSPDPKTGGARRFTTVQAAKLVYTDAERLAHYTGGAALARPGLQVKGAEIRALLSQAGGEQSVERAYADGNAEIVRSSPGRTSTFRGEHAVYHAAEQKIVVNGGEPQLADSAKGVVRGSELTYYANDDRLLVTGAPGSPVRSRIRRK